MKLGDWLVANSKVTREQIQRALQDQNFFGERLGTSLIKLGFITEDTLGEYLADVSGSRYAHPQRLESIPPDVIAAVPARLAARYRIVPIAIEGRALQLAMRDPKDLITLDEITFLTGLTIEPFVATEFRIVRAIERFYGIKLKTKKTIPVAGGTAPAPATPDEGRGEQSEEEISPQDEIGLDGLPLDADPFDVDQPFVDTQSIPAPVSGGPREALPTSLDEWRTAREDLPGEASDGQEHDRKEDVARRQTRPIQPGGDKAPPQPSPGATPAAAPAAAAQVAYHPTAHTMEVVSSRLRSAETRDDIFDAVLDFAAARFHRTAVFVVQQDRMIGWSGRGPGISPSRIRNITVPLDRPSMFVFFRSGGGDYYYGPVPDLPANARLFLDLGFPAPARVLLLPLTIKNRAAVVLYADKGSETGAAPEIAEFRRLLQKASLALEILILRNKIMMI